MIPPVTDPRREVWHENGGVRGETAKTQSEKIDETAARGHGGTSGPNGDIGPSIFSAQSPQYRALYRCWRRCRLVSHAAICEGDLTRIGNGVPTVVQILDLQCQQCVALQKEAREAASEFEDDELQFVVANIRSEKGRRLGNEHRVGHVTLLLFDGNGKLRCTILGPNASAYLERQFRSHVRQVTPQK